VVTTTGQQALALAAELQPRLILLDLMLPHQDGWDILQAFQNSPATRPIPIIICSVLNEPELALALGASDYITKPVSQVTLLAVLRRWLGNLHPAVSAS
jgi:CheY-like chemotaxis protein